MPDAYQVELAIRLKSARQRRGLSQQQVGSALGFTPQSVSNWERGIQGPAPTHLQRLAGLYRMSVRDLVDSSDDNPILTAKTMRLVKMVQELPDFDQDFVHRIVREFHRRWRDGPFRLVEEG